MVSVPFERLSTLRASMSTQTTVLPISAKQVPETRPTYPVPTTAMFMREEGRRSGVRYRRITAKLYRCLRRVC